MGNLIVSTQITLDGVMDSIGGWFNTRGEHSWDVAAGRAAFDQLRAADAVLLGRRTYDALSAIWPEITDAVGFADHFNAKPKLVASRGRLESLTWNATQLDGDLLAAVGAIKQRTDGHLLSYGCGGLAHDLLLAGLVDEIRFWVNPVAWGAGLRAFQDLDPVALELVSSTTYATGVVQLAYRPLPAA
ncbi:MAG TPA: dihydrofolate reductase family protein [Solirubrobacteraceae bacterium]|jgi:dihydrofolate reductase|nr:dihydrofolate reductase family protein [Solirubrobacteraceae bacterium]